MLAAVLFGAAPQSRADLGLGVSGNLGTGFRYMTNKQGESTFSSTERSSDYTLGVSGRIVDPRLATFNIGGTFSTNDINARPKTGIGDTQSLSFSGNLSILPGKPYPLDLRLTKSRFSAGSDTDLLSFGGSWRVVYGNLPSLFLNFDRINVQSTGQNRTDTTFTTGTMRLAKRLGSSDLDAEFGVQNFADNLRHSSVLRHFGRVGDTTQWSPATTLRFTGDYFIDKDVRSLGSIFSLINRPDPTLNRSVSLSVRNFSGDTQRETTLDANGALSKAYQPYATLSWTPFTTVLLSQRLGSEAQGNSTLVNWSLGNSLISSYFSHVLASADYGLGLSYSSQQEDQSGVGTIHQFHAGLQSTTLAPYSIRGDYTLTLERALTERNRHLISLRADGPLAPALFFRSQAEFFNEDAKSTSAETSSSSKQTTLTFGARLSYTGIQRLYVDLGGDISRTDIAPGSAWISRLTANANYRATDRMTVTMTGMHETDTRSELSRRELSTRVQYLWGQATVNLEHRFESRKVFDRPGYGNSITIRVTRPFRFAF